jgi:hypothetical protein
MPMLAPWPILLVISYLPTLLGPPSMLRRLGWCREPVIQCAITHARKDFDSCGRPRRHSSFAASAFAPLHAGLDGLTSLLLLPQLLLITAPSWLYRLIC